MGIVTTWKKRRAEARKRKTAAQAEIKADKLIVAKAKKEIKHATEVIHRHQTTPQKKAIKFALSHVGVSESPAGSNRGPLIDQWEREVDMVAQPWCGAFQHAVLTHAGVKGLSSRIRYVPYIVEDAKAGVNGMLKVVPFAERAPGDLVIFQFDTGAVDHVGMYLGTNPDGTLKTVEGNTSSGVTGSQDNGGCVAVRSRSRNLVAAIVRPRYP